MLQELDFIESDCSALFWALGSTTAIFRHSVPRGLRAWAGKHSNLEEGLTLKYIRKNAARTIDIRVVIAVGVLVCVFALVRLSFLLLPASDLKRVAMDRIVGRDCDTRDDLRRLPAVTLWRTGKIKGRRHVVPAVTLVAHVVVHLITHLGGQMVLASSAGQREAV
jgi:hypothetical protein